MKSLMAGIILLMAAGSAKAATANQKDVIIRIHGESKTYASAGPGLVAEIAGEVISSSATSPSDMVYLPKTGVTKHLLAITAGLTSADCKDGTFILKYSANSLCAESEDVCEVDSLPTFSSRCGSAH